MTIEAPTVDEVRAIVATSLDDYTIQALIDDALLMLEGLACVEEASPEKQKAIVKYVVADMIAGTIATSGAGQVTSKKLGDASESYATNTEAGTFGKSSYWRQALMLAPCLHTLGRRSAFFEKV
jgi:hypothetical protein